MRLLIMSLKIIELLSIPFALSCLLLVTQYVGWLKSKKFTLTVSALSIITIATLLAMSSLPFGNFYGSTINTLSTREKVVALTFDDGPYPPYTNELLAVLQRENVVATFFLVGKNAEQHPELVKKINAAQHIIGVHSYSHQDLLKLSRAEIKQELIKSKAVVQNIIGKEVTLMRTPHGFRDFAVIAALQQENLTLVNWSVFSKDWLNPGVDEIVARTLKNIAPGDIILLHDGDAPYGKSSREQTVQATEKIIQTLKKDGYRFVGLDSL